MFLDQANYSLSLIRGSTPAFLSERSSLTTDSSKALGATNNNTSNEEQSLALAAGSVARVEPEDEEVWGDSPAEELTLPKFQMKASKRRIQVLLGVLVAILTIGLVVVLAVYFAVVRKEDNVKGSAGGSSGLPTGNGTARTISISETKRWTMTSVKPVRHPYPPSRHSPARYERSQVHQRSMFFGPTLDD